MNSKTRPSRLAGTASVMGVLLAVIAPTVGAQDTPAPAAGASSTAPPPRPPSAAGVFSPDPSPYYIGVSQGFTYDSNVYRIVGGPADAYSSTSLVGGFDQQISRQHVFGSATVANNRYRDHSDLDYVSYGVTAGLDWETINSLSGNVNASFNRNLAAPISTSGTGTPRQNIAETQSISARARFGGSSLLAIEGSVGHGQIDYSAPESAVSNSTYDTGALTLFYTGGPLHLGVGPRGTRTRTPQALLDPTTGTYQGNTVTGQNLDFFAGYAVTGLLSANTRLSYTKQTNSGVSSADFSGWTGGLSFAYHATGKIDVTVDVARDAGFDSRFFNSFAVIQSGSSEVRIPITTLYENNRVTDSFGLGATYAATAKIGVRAGARYSQAKISTLTVTTEVDQSVAESTDVIKMVYVGADYAITRNVSAACNATYERRTVSGGVAFAYNTTTAGCSAQLTWR